ncbi:RNA polymerase sigma factor [Candidatus Ozemobacteraceae bacterium]|nr:RNA polymerase sigma factor [Candidatus Ozemobacteraceae bacterium]
MDDEQLLTAAGQGDRKAFRVIYQRFASPLLGFVRRLAPSRSDHEEILQEIMLRLWTKASLFDPARGKARPWIYAVAGRSAMTWLADHGGKRVPVPVGDDPVLEAVPASPDDHPEEVCLRREASRSISEALERIPEEMRLAVVLRHLQGLGIEEIAQVLDCPEGTVKSRIFNGLQRLRSVVGKEERHD